MIQSFKNDETRELFETGSNRRWASIQAVARRKLDQLETAVNLSDMRVPPGPLEALKGNRIGQHRSVSTVNIASALCGRLTGPMR